MKSMELEISTQPKPIILQNDEIDYEYLNMKNLQKKSILIDFFSQFRILFLEGENIDESDKGPDSRDPMEDESQEEDAIENNVIEKFLQDAKQYFSQILLNKNSFFKKIYVDLIKIKNPDFKEDTLDNLLSEFLSKFNKIVYAVNMPKGIAGLTSPYGEIFLQIKIMKKKTSKECIQGALLIMISHEFIHWVLRKINEGKPMRTTKLSPTKDECKGKLVAEEDLKLIEKYTKSTGESGKFFEILCYGEVFQNLYFSQAQFLLKLTNWELNKIRFINEIESLKGKGEKEKETFIKFKNEDQEEECNKYMIKLGRCGLDIMRK